MTFCLFILRKAEVQGTLLIADFILLVENLPQIQFVLER